MNRPYEINSSRYEDLTDEEAVRLAQDEDTRALVIIMERYRDLVRLKAHSYYIKGAGRDDMIQEGMIGLFKAVRDYRADRDASFKAFAELCITRQMITAVKTATRQKHVPLNTYVSLSKPADEGDSEDWPAREQFVIDGAMDPAEMVISEEELDSFRSSFFEMLSDFEAQVLRMYIEGMSYQEIATDLDRHVKSIDNALQRIKRKVEQHLQYREFLARGVPAKGPENSPR